VNTRPSDARADHPLDRAAVLDEFVDWARELGFAHVGVASLDLASDHAHLRDWLARGFHGSMAYLERNDDLRRAPERLVPGTLTIISARMDYMFESPDAAWTALEDSGRAYISRYALGRDYHKTLRGRLRRLAARLAERIGPFGHRVFTDSAPVLERAIARNAGLGWIGKHTNLIDREHGSLFFLGEIFTDLELPVTAIPKDDHCGSCTRCIDVCPTQAIVAPYVLDARRCISYLTIESREPIPEALRPHIGNRIFGCDDCQLVCPWNRYAKLAQLDDFSPRHGLEARRLIDLFNLDAIGFDRITEGSALRRITHEQWLRNIAVALGNAPNDPEVVAALMGRLDHPSEMVREHVAWALHRQGAVQTA
jgi:epoxyqueuosine reductase